MRAYEPEGSGNAWRATEDYDRIHAAADWRRMVQPQADGYDSDVLVELTRERYGWVRDPVESPTWLNGDVTIGVADVPASQYQKPAPVDHPNLAISAELLAETWPAQYEQCRRLLETVFPMLDNRIGISDYGTGCSCGPYGTRWGTLTVTLNGGVGFLEGVIHELAHAKMKSIGISLYHWEKLVANPIPTKEDIERGEGPGLYTSMIRKDLKRPMGAVLQAHYVYIHVGEFLIRLREARPDLATDALTDWIRLQGRRMKESHETLERHVEVTSGAGEAFLEALAEWTISVRDRALA